MTRLVLGLLVLLAVVPCVAQQGLGNECTPGGTWYGGSVVSYQMILTPTGPAGQYALSFQGMYKNAVMTTTYAGTVAKNGKKYEGGAMALVTQDPDFLKPPPIGKLPDIIAGWSSIELVDCNTIKHTMPFLGIYVGNPVAGTPIAGIWLPGTPWSGINWIPNAKVPLVSEPDVDMIAMLTGDVKPIVETYRRLPQTVNPSLLHK